MSGRLELVCGTAGSGKTAWLLDLFRREQAQLLQKCTPGQAVWITPTVRSRRELSRRLLDESLRACLAPNIFTFDSFAERLLHTAGSQVARLSPVARRMLGRSLIDEARAAGTLSYFAPIAETSGFLDSFLSFVSELKRDEIWPEQFEKNCRQRGWLPRDAELSFLYRRYQDRLNEFALYDAEGKFWSARAALGDGQRGAFGHLTLVVIDGFADFTQPQYEIIEHLSKFADRVLISLPCENPRLRSDLFAKSAAAFEEINRNGQAAVTWLQTPIDPIENAVATFRHIAQHLFDNPRTAPKLDTATGLEIVESAGPNGEARVIAERVRALLLEGVPADQIVIAVRGSDEESTILRETLAAAGIPHDGTVRLPFARTPVARAMLCMLRNELADWDFESLCTLLRLNQFRPSWPSLRAPQSVDVTIRLLRKRKLGSGRLQILHRLLMDVETANSADGPADSSVALGLLRQLSIATEGLRQPASFAGWVDRIVSLSDELGIGRPARPGAPSTAESDTELDARDAEDWERLKDVLYEAAQTLSLLGDKREFDLGEFVRRLQDILDSQEFAAEPKLRGGVRILDAADVRNLEVPHLFLAGLSDASFPRSRPDDCLYSQNERRNHARQRSTATIGSSPHQDEMLLFYSIVTRARQSLTLSYPAVNASGQPLFPSPYVTALRSLFQPASLRVTAYTELDPVPSPERAMTETDLRLVATEEVRSERPALFRLLAERPNSEAAARSVIASSDMAAARFEQSGFSPYEGMLQRGANVRQMEKNFHRDLQFSATQLEMYAYCPFRFLLSQVLKIEPQPAIETAIDARERGVTLHRILKLLHTPASEKNASAADNPSGAQISALLRQLAERHLSAPEECTPFERAIATVERQFTEMFAEWYAVQWDAYHEALGQGWDTAASPRFVELPFGDVPLRGQAPHPHAQPFATFGKGAELVRVQGQIDRIDVGRRGTETAFAVVDYKTRQGQRFELKDVREGLALQLAIYVAAIRQSKLLGPDAGLFQLLYWNLTRDGCVLALKGNKAKRWEPVDPSALAEIEQTLHDLLPRMAGGIRHAEFPVRSADEHCTGWCPYSTVCRVTQVRSVTEERQKIWNLAPL
jgi:ATP-dependent helicase/nuclease subunit B